MIQEEEDIKMKHYNPFKMWGSYVGAILLILSLILLGVLGFGAGMTGQSSLASNNLIVGLISPPAVILSYILLGDGATISDLLILIISQLIYGFLIGWGIQSLIRKLRR